MKYLPVLVTICGASQVLGVRNARLRVPEQIVVPIVPRPHRVFEFSHPFDPNALGLDARLASRHPGLRYSEEYVCVYREVRP